MRAIIIDDEPKARQNIVNLISLLNFDIQIVGEASDVVSGYNLIKQEQPDFIFLDIQMPDGSGFDLLKMFDKIDFKVIFVTAFDQYAIDAFRHDALDYLLKPINPKDFQEAINRVKAIHDDSLNNSKIMSLLSKFASHSEQKILLKTNESMHLVNLSEIVRCESDRGYTFFFLKDGRKILVSNVIKTFESILPISKFLRTHQSHMVNIDYIDSFIRSDGGYLFMKDGSNVPVAKRKRDEVIAVLESLNQTIGS